LSQLRKLGYVTLNPMDPELPASRRAAGDADVLRRLWLLVDCDPVRAAGTSATEEEKALAMELAAAVRGWLWALGWPPPVLADSANGGHLVYAIELPNDAAARDLVQAVLEALARRFDTPRVKIDTSVFNASRICKLYGTLTCKGEDAPERPHRRSRVLEVPRPLEVVSRDLLEALAAMGKPATGDSAGSAGSAGSAALPRGKPGAKAKDEATTWVGTSAADDYAARADWAEILGPHGWRVEKEMPDGEVRWTRPGKPPKEGCSATTDHDGRPVFKVYSDAAAPFAKGGAYSKFQTYAILNHAGDEPCAAKILYAKGYGTRQPTAGDSAVSAVSAALPWGTLKIGKLPEDPGAPLEVLPPKLRDLCRQLADANGVDPGVPLVMILAAASGLIGKGFAVRITPTWKEGSSLYIALIMPPGGGKSPVQQLIMGPVRDVEEAMSLRGKAAREQAEADYQALAEGAKKRDFSLDTTGSFARDKSFCS
jgi:uncharacterized protein DUF3987